MQTSDIRETIQLLVDTGRIHEALCWNLHDVEQVQQQLRHGRVDVIREMPATLQLPARATHQQTRQREVTVDLPVAHATAIHDERVVQQRSVTVRGRAQPLEKVRQ